MYAAYMEQQQQKSPAGQRSRRVTSASSPQQHADAGVVYNSPPGTDTQPFQLRTTQGKGCPPKDNNYAEWRSTNIMHKERSHTCTKDLLRTSWPAPDYCTAMSDTESLDSFSTGITSLSRLFDSTAPAQHFAKANGRGVRKMSASMSLRSSLVGSGLTIVHEEPTRRPLTARGAFSPTADTMRVFADAKGQTELAAVALRRAELWAAQALEARALVDSRPATAPARDNEARAYGRSASARHADVFRYRYSGGICADEYKFEGVRVATPAFATEPTSPDRVFVDSRRSYSLNRVRGLTGTDVF
ncbi:hypothetical protein FOA52_009335 [Chlamydomonas sp. UWO 241]|nr:hypothetical protein FOA52_009335 [Chlamydomonas sp. UWO 241]